MLYEYTFLGTPAVNIVPITSSITAYLKERDSYFFDAHMFWVDKRGRINYNYNSETFTDVRFTDTTVTYQSTSSSLPRISGTKIGEGDHVWEMNGHIYFNWRGGDSYELNDSNQWVEKTWTFNLTNPGSKTWVLWGSSIWHLGDNYYGVVRGTETGQEAVDVQVKYNSLTGAWDEYTTASGATSTLDLSDNIWVKFYKCNIWEDGTNAYYSSLDYYYEPGEEPEYVQYIWDKTKLGWVPFSHTAVKKDGTTISNYNFSEPIKVNGELFTIAKSIYPDSNWKKSPRDIYKWNKTSQRWEYYDFVVDPYEKYRSLDPEVTYVANNKVYVHTIYHSSFANIPQQYAPHRIIIK